MLDVIKDNWYAFYCLGLTIVFAVIKWFIFRKGR